MGAAAQRFSSPGCVPAAAIEYNGFPVAKSVTCPYFNPMQRSEAELWPFRHRLPLGDGWTGHCCAPGHEGVLPLAEELAEACNLGYARRCPRLPHDRLWDAVRFGIARDHENRIAVCYVCERNYLPVEHGTLEYDGALRTWVASHANARLQRQAECFLESYLRRRDQAAPDEIPPHSSVTKDHES